MSKRYIEKLTDWDYLHESLPSRDSEHWPGLIDCPYCAEQPEMLFREDQDNDSHFLYLVSCTNEQCVVQPHLLIALDMADTAVAAWNGCGIRCIDADTWKARFRRPSLCPFCDLEVHVRVSEDGHIVACANPECSVGPTTYDPFPNVAKAFDDWLEGECIVSATCWFREIERTSKGTHRPLTNRFQSASDGDMPF